MRISTFMEKARWETPEAGGPGGEPAADPAPEPDYQAQLTEAQAEIGRLQEAVNTSRDGIPETPDAYEFALPEDLDFGDIDLPEGWSPQIDADNPLFGDLRTWMHTNGIKADQAGSLMGMLAKYEAGKAANFKSQAASEMEALGPKASERVAAVKSALQNRLRDEELVSAISAAAMGANGVRAIEKLLSNGGTTPNPTPKPVPGEDLRGFERLKAIRAAK